MKKVLYCIAFVMLGCFLLVAFAGCSNKILHINDIERYADMQKSADKIEVNFDNGTKEGFRFTIDDSGEISDVMEIIFSVPIEACGKGAPAPLGNTYITVYQEDRVYGLGKYYVMQDDEFYSFTTRDLADKIDALALDAGAFEEPEDSDKPEVDNSFSSGMIELSAAETKEIKAAFVKKNPNLTEDGVGLRCFGSFNGAYVLFVDFYAPYGNAICHETVSGVEFIYSNTHTLSVYFGGEFYSLKEAFEQGFLTHEDLLAAQKNYRMGHEFLYKY